MRNRRLRGVAVMLGMALLGSGLIAGTAGATFPGPTTALHVVESQTNPNDDSVHTSISRYNPDGSFSGSGQSCGDVEDGLDTYTNSRIWAGTSAWGDGAFVSCINPDGNSNIWFMERGEFPQRENLTPFAGSHYDPAVSPDGTTLAFSSDTEGRRQICLLGVDDTTPDCVTGNTFEGEDWAPVWNPFDPGHIVFVSTVDGDADLYSYRPGDETSWPEFPITDNTVSDFGPDFSPTAMDVLVYSSNVEGFDQIFTLNISDREPTQLTSDANSNYEPVFSPDGSKIAFVKQATSPGSLGRVYLMPAGGGEAVALDNQDFPSNEYTHPEWEQVTDSDGDGGGDCEPNCEIPTEDRWFGAFKVVKHLKAKGQLYSESGDYDCLEGHPVKIQRRQAGTWKTIKTVTSGFEGSFITSIPDKPGSYRAKIKDTVSADPEFPVTCSKATSAVVKHRH